MPTVQGRRADGDMSGGDWIALALGCSVVWAVVALLRGKWRQLSQAIWFSVWYAAWLLIERGWRPF